DLSALLNHTHHEEPFDDFARQPLLPHKLSQSGPGMAWVDLDGDHWDDLVIGSGKGGQLAVFLNRQGKTFERVTRPPFDGVAPRDQTTVLGWRQGTNRMGLLVGSASYEDGDAQSSCVLRYDAASTKPQAVVAGHSASVGAMALGDIDGDGNLDLFVGGQVVPGKYPQSASSLVFRFRDGKFQRDEENSALLAEVGLVNGAVWSDLDGDGLPELVLACEWGPVKIFRNDHGRLVPWDPPVTFSASAGLSQRGTRNSPAAPKPGEGGKLGTLSQFTGLWTGVTAGDFDGDGRLDLVVGNWGLNGCSGAALRPPLVLFYGDIAGHGMVDIVQAEFDSA